MRGRVIQFDAATNSGFAQAWGKDFWFCSDTPLTIGQTVRFSPSDERGQLEAFFLEPLAAAEDDSGSEPEPRPRRELSGNGYQMPAVPGPSFGNRNIEPRSNGAGSHTDAPNGKTAGTIVYYNDQKRFGFLRVLGRSSDVFFHHSDFRGPFPIEGQRCEFVIVPGQRRPWEARRVTPLAEVESNHED